MLLFNLIEDQQATIRQLTCGSRRTTSCSTREVLLAQRQEDLPAVARIGYTGPVMVEPFSQRVRELPPEDAVRVTGEALNKV